MSLLRTGIDEPVKARTWYAEKASACLRNYVVINVARDTSTAVV
jgi:hypothetical protein